jgi:dihydroorotate dehydrogenase (fumarate)
MADLSTHFAGLTLKNPIIVGSCGLTNSVEHLLEFEKNGAAAVVLKSIFEEEIQVEFDKVLKDAEKKDIYPENLDYYDYKIKQETVGHYIEFIRNAKKQLSIPVFASVNCVSAHEWTYFAKKIEEAGADGLELNIFIAPSEINTEGKDLEKRYFDIIEKVRSETKLPIVVKLSHYFTNLGNMIQRISETGIQGLVLFNRFFSPDIDIKHKKIVPTHIFSTPEEISTSLKWIALTSSSVKCDLAASTGIHSGEAVVKQLLAGAGAVQIASTVYKNGFAHISTMLTEIEKYMDNNNYSGISNFKGKMSSDKAQNHVVYERMQFMKYLADSENEKLLN